jgi:hypothetical protein
MAAGNRMELDFVARDCFHPRRPFGRPATDGHFGAISRD